MNFDLPSELMPWLEEVVRGIMEEGEEVNDDGGTA